MHTINFFFIEVKLILLILVCRKVNEFNLLRQIVDFHDIVKANTMPQINYTAEFQLFFLFYLLHITCVIGMSLLCKYN